VINQAYDFSNLTNAQEWLIVLQGWRIGKKWPDGTVYVQPSRRTVKKLIDRGLVTAVPVKDRGMTVIEYRVSLDVHFAYCMWCD
jgi:hypothetical protein